MYPVDFRERLVKGEQNKTGNVNCISAAFYLLGLKNKEENIYPDQQNDEIVNALEVIDRRRDIPDNIPDEAVLVGVWGGSDYWHLGVISPFNRTQIIDRPNHGFPIRFTTCQKIYHECFNRPPDSLFNFLKNADPSFDFLKVRPEMYLK
jgi:hypothetical protein